MLSSLLWWLIINMNINWYKERHEHRKMPSTAMFTFVEPHGFLQACIIIFRVSSFNQRMSLDSDVFHTFLIKKEHFRFEKDTKESIFGRNSEWISWWRSRLDTMREIMMITWESSLENVKGLVDDLRFSNGRLYTSKFSASWICCFLGVLSLRMSFTMDEDLHFYSS